MTFDLERRLVLGVSGLTAAAIGLAITLDPQAFYSSHGIQLTPQPSLMSELRAPGAGLSVLGLIILAGAFVQGMASRAASLGAAVFFAFAAGRLVSFALDGRPTDGILLALGLEFVLGLLCFRAAGQGTSATPAGKPDTAG
jgi:hypothetical protein